MVGDTDLEKRMTFQGNSKDPKVFRFKEEPGIKQYEIKKQIGKNHFRVYLIREEIETGKILTQNYICDEVRF